MADERELHAVEVAERSLLVGAVNGEAEPARRVLAEASESGVARVGDEVWPGVPDLRDAGA